jgi:DNA-binding CsgD family transcriptional regulator
MVVAGEAGIGKTALVDATVEHARASGMRVLRTLGVEQHCDLAYGGLSALLAGVLHHLDRLPPVQGQSIRGALAIAHHPVSTLAVHAGLLGVLTAEAEQSAVLVVVDDAQWVDRATLDALLFCAHRLDHDAVALLIVVRTGHDDPVETGRLPRIDLAGVDAAAAEQIMAAQRPIHHAVAEQCWRATHGNPLALGELTSVLTASQRSGREPLPDPLPLGLQLGSILRRRVDAMAPATRLALLVAAAEGAGDLGAIGRSLTSIGGSLDDLAPAERSNLVRCDAGSLSWSHPLLRAAVYHAPSAPERRAIHRSLAAALDPATQYERYAWHLALAVEGPDDIVADHLAKVAAIARKRGACFSAARAYERAARLTNDPCQRARHLHEAGTSLWLAGVADASIAYFAEAAELTDDDELRAVNATLWGQAELWVHGAHVATGLFESEAERVAGRLPGRAVVLWCHLVNVHVLSLRMDRAVAAGRRAMAMASTLGPAEQAAAAVAAGLALTMHGDHAEADALVGPLHDLVVSLADTDIPGIEDLAQALAVADISRERWPQAEDLLARTIRRGRRLGMHGAISFAVAQLAELQWRSGRWAEAYAATTELVQLGQDAGDVEPITIASAYLSRIEAGLGLAADCRAHATLAIERAESRGLHSLAAWARSSLGLLALGRGEAREALRWLAPVAEETHRGSAGEPGSLWWHADWIEALWRTGDVRGARAALAEFEAAGMNAPSVWVTAASARCRGLLDDGPGATERFRQAIERFNAIGAPFERARSELCIAEHLARVGDGEAARLHADRACDTFARLGAADWTGRAELLRIGTDAHRNPLAALTPSERRVALAIGQGLSNRESAERLYVSVKTIDYHLQNIYRKLDLRSRGQLAALVHGGSQI